MQDLDILYSAEGLVYRLVHPAVIDLVYPAVFIHPFLCEKPVPSHAQNQESSEGDGHERIVYHHEKSQEDTKQSLTEAV